MLQINKHIMNGNCTYIIWIANIVPKHCQHVPLKLIYSDDVSTNQPKNWFSKEWFNCFAHTALIWYAFKYKSQKCKLVYHDGW